jgi:hypothetical protein
VFQIEAARRGIEVRCLGKAHSIAGPRQTIPDHLALDALGKFPRVSLVRGLGRQLDAAAINENPDNDEAVILRVPGA